MTEEPPKIAKIALVLSAILWIATMGYALTFLNSIEARPTNQPSTQAPDDNTKPHRSKLALILARHRGTSQRADGMPRGVGTST